MIIIICVRRELIAKLFQLWEFKLILKTKIKIRRILWLSVSVPVGGTIELERMKTYELLHLLFLLSLLVPLRAQRQGCRFLGSMLLINKFDPCPNISSPPQSDMFYLKLDMARKAQGLGECSSSDHMNYTTTLKDMCRPSFTERDEMINESLMNVTCPSYRTLNVNGSLGICKEVLNSLGYCVTLVSYNETVTTNGAGGETLLYNGSSLNKTVHQIQSTLGKYFQVIDRTLVGSFFKDRAQRCLCLVSSIHVPSLLNDSFHDFT